jgi:hypothetical protein
MRYAQTTCYSHRSDPPKSPLKRGTKIDSPLFKGGQGGSDLSCNFLELVLFLLPIFPPLSECDSVDSDRLVLAIL